MFIFKKNLRLKTVASTLASTDATNTATTIKMNLLSSSTWTKQMLADLKA